nr:MAG TPA: YycJ-like MBL-fold protein [Caudoviricetes sp.]
MLLNPYASSSRGNLYAVDDGQTRILLECGLPLPKMQARLPHKLGEYAGCLVTHEHRDHSRCVEALLLRGVDVYMTDGTATALLLEPSIPTLHTVRYGESFLIGTLRIKPFKTVHDCTEPCGYLIHSDVNGELLAFATDTAVLKYRFKGLTEIAVECNYSAEILAASQVPKVVRERSARTHMALETLCCWLRASDLERVTRIWLCHLSANHGSANGFRSVVHNLTGIDTVVCDA